MTTSIWQQHLLFRFFFFFQAEDGIRDLYVTGVQTCALPILKSGKTIKEIIVGLHSCALAKSPDGKFVAVANANSDTISIIDCGSDTVMETISARWDPGDLFGASPNALTFDAGGKTLYVCNGAKNAIAVIDFSPGGSKLRGLIPTGWYPGAIVNDSARGALYVANIKGVGSGKRPAPGEAA